MSKFFRRIKRTAPVQTEQQMLDLLRYNNADDQLMQLHCDRMQSALNRAR